MSSLPNPLEAKTNEDGSLADPNKKVPQTKTKGLTTLSGASSSSSSGSSSSSVSSTSAASSSASVGSSVSGPSKFAGSSESFSQKNTQLQIEQFNKSINGGSFFTAAHHEPFFKQTQAKPMKHPKFETNIRKHKDLIANDNTNGDQVHTNTLDGSVTDDSSMKSRVDAYLAKKVGGI